MNWINSVVRPKIRSFLNKRESPENLWVKCPQSGEMVFYRDLEANQWVVPNSGFHMKIKARDRMKAFLDKGEYTEHEVPDVAHDPLKFRATKKYADQLRDYRAKTDMKDCVLLASGKLIGRPVTVGVQDFDFGGGSLGMAAGATIVKGLEMAVKNKTPFILFTASGGARMQEGMLSLMQMPRTTVAVARLREAGLPYIVVFTDPTTGGVTASYAMLGDVQIAEPNALIGFAGQRVIEQTIRESLPKGFQRSEYLLEHGMLDMVVHRHNLRPTIGKLVGMFMKSPLNDMELNAPKKQTVRDAIVAAEGAGEDADNGPAENSEDITPPPVAHAE